MLRLNFTVPGFGAPKVEAPEVPDLPATPRAPNTRALDALRRKTTSRQTTARLGPTGSASNAFTPAASTARALRSLTGQ